MRRSPAYTILAFLFLLPVSLLAQQTPQTAKAPVRDQQAIAVLQQSFAAMGRTLPADSLATGTVTIVEGSNTHEGTIRITTRGHDQSLEDITTSTDHRIVVYSRLSATETKGGKTVAASFELSASSQSPDFPLPFIAWALTSPDAGAVYVGLEELNGEQLHHIRIYNAFASIPALQSASEFTIRDVWIDANRFHPRKIAYQRRRAGGAVPRIPVEVFFADYRNVGGVLYPFQIQKNLNGTPWTTITISAVQFNTGLSDTDFPVSVGGAK